MEEEGLVFFKSVSLGGSAAGHAATGVGDKFKSMVLKEPGSVLMIVAHVTTDAMHMICATTGAILM